MRDHGRLPLGVLRGHGCLPLGVMRDYGRLPLEDEVHAGLVRVEHVLQLRVLGHPLRSSVGVRDESAPDRDCYSGRFLRGAYHF